MTHDIRTTVTREKAVAHWELVLKTSGLAPISYQYAREALAMLRAADEFLATREPGEEG